MSTEQMTVEQMNKLIAEFMGLVVVPSGTKAMGEIREPEMPEAFLKYHSSWNSLMPVIEKIEELGYSVKIDTNYITIAKYNNIVQLFNTEKSKINMVYRAVYDFITWYKTQPK